MNYALYRITNLVNGKEYIGATKDIARRTKEHKGGNTGSKLVKYAITKYGIENFEFVTLCIGTKEYISDLEELVIDKFNTLVPHGYNKMKGGFPTEPVIIKNNPGRTGKTNSDKQKAAVSLAMKGKKKDYDVWSKGKSLPQSTKDKISAANKGNTWTEEQKKRQSIITSERVCTPEYKAAQSIRMKKMWADRKARLYIESITTNHKD